MILSVFLKLGLFPFHAWFFNLINYLSFLPFFLLLTFQKLPLLLFLFNNFRDFTIFLLFSNLIMGALFLFFRKSFIIVLGSSSIYSTFWLFSFFICNFFIFFSFIINYFFFFFILSKEGTFIKLNKNNLALYFISVTFLIGYPPFRLFFFKFFRLLILSYSSLLIILIIWIFTFLAIISYFYFFINYFFQPMIIYYCFQRKRKIIWINSLISLFLFEVFFI